ncbi:MAG: 50S ribosomal protein L22 [Gemmatales bacterium]|nr:50S ribosomal protein L22 [Gemmatales bacterium]MDW8223242.1 50S ribosomal protein L22 [Gemmatales bacterium]
MAKANTSEPTIFHAHHYFADMGARKLRPFAQLIRYKTVDEALELLRYYPNRGARLLEKVVRSAMANAVQQGVRRANELVVIEARIDGGPMWKRVDPRARGMAYLIRRRLAHIHVVLAPPGE